MHIAVAFYYRHLYSLTDISKKISFSLIGTDEKIKRSEIII